MIFPLYLSTPSNNSQNLGVFRAKKPMEILHQTLFCRHLTETELGTRTL